MLGEFKSDQLFVEKNETHKQFACGKSEPSPMT